MAEVSSVPVKPEKGRQGTSGVLAARNEPAMKGRSVWRGKSDLFKRDAKLSGCQEDFTGRLIDEEIFDVRAKPSPNQNQQYPRKRIKGSPPDKRLPTFERINETPCQQLFNPLLCP
jgi:hypothetical protein